MATVGFLHTSTAHVPTFEQLVTDLGGGTTTSIAEVDEPLLDLARAGDAAAVADAVRRHVRALHAGGADVIVCTCSTVGAIAEQVGASLGVDVRRVDRAMAERAADVGGRVVVLAAVESTVAPTVELLRSVERPGRPMHLDMRLIAGAWRRFEAGDWDGYLGLVADEIAAAAATADVIVLAQASMAEAATRADVAVPVLASPRLAVAAAVA